MINLERAIDYLNTCEQLYVIDGFAGWDPQYRLKIRVICSRAYHALFMHNMLIRPSEAELDQFAIRRILPSITPAAFQPTATLRR